MDTKIHFSNWAGKHLIITIMHIRGCSDEHDNPIHDGLTCCYTRWKMHDKFGNPWLTSHSRMETNIPHCIKFTIGDKLFDADNPINVESLPRNELLMHASIKMSCSLGCHDFYGIPENDNLDENLGVYSPLDVREMLDRAIRHAEKHADIRETRDFDLNIRDDGVHDIRLKESGFYECCMGDQCKFSACNPELDDDFRIEDFDTMTFGGMSIADAKKHHEFYKLKKQSEILASSQHPQIGEVSPVGVIDIETIKNILSLTQ